MENDTHFKVLFGIAVLTLITGMFGFSVLEGWSLFDSFYFSVITLTTVGYGDISPVTFYGKIFTIFYVFIGIGIIFGFVNAIAKARFENALGNRISKYLPKRIYHRKKKGKV